MINNGIKIFIASVLFISLLAVLIVIFTSKPQKVQEEIYISDMDFSERLSYEDFKIPDDYKLNFEQGIIQYRESNERWSWAQIEEFWEDPEKLGLEMIEKENDGHLEQIFDKVP